MYSWSTPTRPPGCAPPMGQVTTLLTSPEVESRICVHLSPDAQHCRRRVGLVNELAWIVRSSFNVFSSHGSSSRRLLLTHPVNRSMARQIRNNGRSTATLRSARSCLAFDAESWDSLPIQEETSRYAQLHSVVTTRCNGPITRLSLTKQQRYRSRHRTR